MQQIAEQRYVSPYYRALAALGLGDKEQALDWLEKACEERSCWMVNLHVEPAMDLIRAHPRFQNLLRRVRLPA